MRELIAKASTLPFMDSMNALADSTSNLSSSPPWRLWPPEMSMRYSGSVSPSYFLPIDTRATRPCLPSTTALVASVDESDTISVLRRRSLSSPRMESRIPSERSRCVVRDLLFPSTSPVSISTSTESVNVPPVSMPSPMVMVVAEARMYLRR